MTSMTSPFDDDVSLPEFDDQYLPGFLLPQFMFMQNKLRIHTETDRINETASWKFYVPSKYSNDFLPTTVARRSKYRPSYAHQEREVVERVRDICASCLACWLSNTRAYDSDHLLLMERVRTNHQRTSKRSPVLDAFIQNLGPIHKP